MLESVSHGNQLVPHGDVPRETVRVGTWSNPWVHEDPKTNWALFVIFHSLEEHALQPNSFHRCDLNDAMCLISIFGHPQLLQVVRWNEAWV
jgi:hypothetical protein